MIEQPRKIAILKVESINYSIKPEEERKAIIYSFQKFLNSLDFPIQILMNTGTLDLDSYLKASEKKEIKEEVFKKIHDEYVKFLKKTVWDNSILNKSFYVVIPETNDLDNQVKICQDRLISLNLKSERLTKPQLISLIYNPLPEAIKNNVDSLKIIKRFETKEEWKSRLKKELENILREHISKEEKIKKIEEINITNEDREFHRIIYAYGYPRMVESGFLDKLVSCSGNFDLSLHIEPCSIENTLVMLNRELQKQRADLYAAQIKNQLSPSLEIKYADTRRVLEELQKGTERLFNVSLYIDCKAKTLKDLNTLTRKLESELNSLLIIPKQAKFRMVQGFRSCMPFAKDELNIKRNITTSALSAFFPFTSSFFKFDDTGVWLGSNKNGIPIIRDIFKLSNANGICLATSGSGKSYMAKLLISRYLMNGVKVLVIDPQGEYAKLVEKFKGERIDLSVDSDNIINPLDLMGHEYNEKRLALMDLMPVMLGELSEPQKAFIDIAITRAYESKGINKESETWNNVPPIMGDLVNILIRMGKKATSIEQTSIRSLVNRLNMYVNGVFSFLNKQTNINFKNNFVCFDIGNLPKQVKPAVMFLVLDYIYTKMRHSLERKLLVIDEAWSLLSRTEDASYILEIVKTCRKFNLGLFLINQEVENMLDSQAGRSVLANTSYTLLLRQKPAMIRSIQNVFHLSEAEKVLLLTAIAGEGLLLMENEHSEITIKASDEEHEIITTNADELLTQKKEVTKKTPSKIRQGQKAYLKKELGEAEFKFLTTSGFKEVRENGISRKKETYLVIEDKNESPNHIICIKEIVDYLKQFTQNVQTYRTVKPDIVFDVNGQEFAIEVETGKVNNQKQLREKIANLKKYYGKNWFFFITNRNLFNCYSRFGKILNKRTFKTKIDKIFKNSQF